MVSRLDQVREAQAAKHAELDAHMPIFSAELDHIFTINQETWEMEAALSKGMLLFRKICDNIIKNPREQKYRTINSTNTKISSELFSLSGNLELFVTTAGFVEDPKKPGHFVYENTPGGDVTALAKKVLFLTEGKM